MKTQLFGVVLALAAVLAVLPAFAENPPAAPAAPAAAAAAPAPGAAPAAPEKPADPNAALGFANDKERYSYAVGMMMGKNLKTIMSDVDIDAMVATMRDAVAGKEMKMDETAVRQAMMDMTTAAGTRRKTESDTFFAENEKKEGVKKTESGLQYKVIKEGDGPMPTDTDNVKVHYTGTLLDGTKFDSSRDRGTPAEFQVTRVILGWTEALKLMKKGSQWQLWIPANLAYGERGRPSIPGNSALIFDVELLDITAAPEPSAADAAKPGMPGGLPGGMQMAPGASPHGAAPAVPPAKKTVTIPPSS